MGKSKIRKGPGATLPPEILERPIPATELARLLSQGPGKPVEPALIRSHVKQGAPADKRGRLGLADYAAWLIRRLAERA